MIREMQNEDLKCVAGIWLEDSIRLHSFFPDADKFWPERVPHFLLETRTAIGYVCEAAGAVNGFMTMRADNDRTYYVCSLYVDFYLRRHGLGRDLLKQAKLLADRLHLHMYEKDTAANGTVVDVIGADAPAPCRGGCVSFSPVLNPCP
jgi:putative acetyltransferase